MIFVIGEFQRVRWVTGDIVSGCVGRVLAVRGIGFLVGEPPRV